MSLFFDIDMATLTAKEIIEATRGKLLSGNSKSLDHRKKLSHNFKGVSIDSRTISDGEIFFALRGQRFNGHDFIGEAVSKGAGGVVIERETKFTVHPVRKKAPRGLSNGVNGSRFTVIIVKDTLKALQDLAHFLRVRRNIPVVAITGSNGKTTTKEMTYTILLKRFKVIKNEGNLNNQFGLPLSLTRLAPDDEMVVLELGMNALGEIKRLCDIAVPSHGVITNIGSAHIGELGDLDSIRSAKLEILQGLTVVVLNADDSFLMQGYESIRMHKGFGDRLITFSVNNDSHVRAENVVATDNGSSFTLRVKGGESIALKLNVHGLFNVYNALAASAVCLSLGITVEEIKTALEGYTAFPMRFEVMRRDKITLINDSYNANPSSMEEALKELVRMRGKGRAVAILGDMLELGEFSEKAHRTIGKMVSDIGVNVFVAVGEMMSFAAGEGKKVKGEKLMPAIYIFRNVDEASGNVMNIIRQGDTVLIKGSRAMGMEKILEEINVI